MNTSIKLLCTAAVMISGMLRADEPPPIRVLKDIFYRAADESDAYARSRCKLDLYLPPGDVRGFPVIVWFHGGGLGGGSKDGSVAWAPSFAAQGVAVAAVNYRLTSRGNVAGRARYPAYIQDAAAAVAWVHANIEKHGGDPRRVFIAGFSAGAYLTAMITLDRRWLTEAGMNPDAVAGALPISGQMYTHGTIRSERSRAVAATATETATVEAPEGAEEESDAEPAPAAVTRRAPVIDEAAPLFHPRTDAPPIFLFVGEQEGGRVIENRRMHEALLKAGHSKARFQIFPERNHGGMVRRLSDPTDTVRNAMLEFIREIVAGQE